MNSVLALCIAWRLLNAAICQTFFAPDEYFQATEIAHKLVFDQGFETWEWRQQSRIRSILHPSIYAMLYFVASKTLPEVGIQFVTRYGGQILHAIFAGIMDWYTVRLAGRMRLGAQGCTIVLILTLTSWFHFYCSTRTLGNTMETFLSTVALYYWPLTLPEQLALSVDMRKFRLSLVLATLSIVVRPTAALNWVVLGGILVVSLFRHAHLKLVGRVISTALVIVLSIFTLSIALDSWYYGELTVVMYNFLHINLVQNISLFYGSNSWHWYLSQGLPIMLTTLLPVAIHSLYGYFFYHETRSPVDTLWPYILMCIVPYSLAGHKEYRFLYPLLPTFILISGQQLTLYAQNRRKLSVSLIMITQLLMAVYMAHWHQRGAVDVMDWLRHYRPNEALKVTFLMPCHSTPYYSYLHRQNVKLTQISCEPPLGADPLTYLDESDIFYQDPTRWINENIFKEDISSPDVVVAFQDLLDTSHGVKKLLKSNCFTECSRHWNTHWTDDSRRRGYIIAFCASDCPVTE